MITQKGEERGRGQRRLLGVRATWLGEWESEQLTTRGRAKFTQHLSDGSRKSIPIALEVPKRQVDGLVQQAVDTQV